MYYAQLPNLRFRASGPILCAWKESGRIWTHLVCLEKSEECHADYIFTFAHLTYSDIFF